MKIIVTGGLGHIGSRLIRELPHLFDNPEIVVIDNLSTQRYGSLFNLPDGAHYRFVEGDIVAMDMQYVLEGADAVVHLAALTDATASFYHPEEMERVNFAATKQIAEMCAKSRVPLVHASSTSVYGTKASSVDENCGPEDVVPQSPYAICKHREELLVQGMCRAGDLQAVTFRFGTIFGTSSGMRFHTAVNKFCWQATYGKPLTVWKTAYDQRRPYLDLDDAVKAVAFAIRERIFDGRVYNVVTTNATVRQVTDIIRGYIPELSINFVDSPIMNLLSYDVINSRLDAAGFKVQGSLARGVENTLRLLGSVK